MIIVEEQDLEADYAEDKQRKTTRFCPKAWGKEDEGKQSKFSLKTLGNHNTPIWQSEDTNRCSKDIHTNSSRALEDTFKHFRQ